MYSSKLNKIPDVLRRNSCHSSPTKSSHFNAVVDKFRRSFKSSDHSGEMMKEQAVVGCRRFDEFSFSASRRGAISRVVR